MKSVRTKGELGIEDLPPIEDLDISVEESKCKEIGTIDSIVDSQGYFDACVCFHCLKI